MQKLIRHAAALLVGLVFVASVQADWGIFQTYAFLDAGDGMIGYAGNSNADGAPALSANTFTFVEGQSTFTLQGGEIKTWKNGASNVCGGNLFYRVHPSADAPGDFASIALGYQSELANPGDQKWGTYDQQVDLLSGLAPGNYTLEVFWNFTGGQFGGCAETQYESNDGNNYSLSFTIETPEPCVNTFTMDYLGVTYDLAEAGGRCWFAENLQATTFNNGTEIPQAITGLSWQYPGANPYRLPPGSSTGWVSEFGWLYNGGAASNGGICPSGWRVPSVAQWQALIDAFGGNDVAGGAFKETGNVTDQTGTWAAPNTGATNESGMTLRGAGLAYPHDFEHGFRSYGLFWTSDYAVTDPTFAVQEKYVIALRYDAPTALVEQYTIPHGFSIRCIQRNSGCKDNTACNYDASVDDNDPTQCIYPELVAYADADGDGAGDPASTVAYCTDVPEGYVLVAGDACPDDAAKTDPGACGCGASDVDSDQDGVLDCNEVAGCVDESACNYNAEATDEGACYWLPAAPVEWEGLAVSALQPSLQVAGPEGAADVLWVAPSGTQQTGLSAVLDEVGDWTVSWASNAGNESPSCNASATITVVRMGCTDATACNYDGAATTAGVDCLHATAPCDTCSGATDGTGSVVDGDTNANGTCDDSEVAGCMDDTACNYDAEATVPDESCLFATGCDTCGPTGNVIDGDADNDGVCDGDEVAGCTDAAACNYDAAATDADDSCVYPVGCQVCSGATDGTGTVLSGDADGDGVCDADEVLACTDPEACNYNSDPTVDTDNSLCDFTGDCNGDCEGTATTTSTGCCIGGNTGYDAYNCSPQGMLCDYDVQVGSTSSSPVGGFTFQAGMTGALSRIRMITLGGSGERAEVRNRDTGELLGQGVPDSEGYTGSYVWRSFTFSDLALEEGAWYKVTLTGGYYQWIGQNSSNSYPGGTKYGINASTSGYATFKTIVCDPVPGCMDQAACNYDATANLSATCLYADDPCEVCNAIGGVDNLDEDGDGVCDADEVPGCTDQTACNYDLGATDDDGSCILLEACEECVNGAAAFIDVDGDGVCDLDDACTDLEACNYAHPANEACLYANGPCEICTVLGGVDNFDADGDGICDEDEIPGCQDEAACNFNAFATDSDDSCVYATANCEVCLNGAPVIQDADDDGVCDGNEIPGCQDAAACNYNANATDSDNSCVYATANCEVCLNGAPVIQDADSDGVCDGDEVPGCQDAAACNYNAAATDSDNSCVYATGCATCSGANDGTGSVLANDADGDGVCDADEVAGCQDDTACNYNATATDSDNSCVYATGCATCSGATDGTGTVLANDADGDGVCDADEVAGCQDDTACNFNAAATDSDNSCVYATGCATCSGATDGTGTVLANDADGDGVCDADEVLACTDPEACNYNDDPTADTDNALCVYDLDCNGDCGGTATTTNTGCCIGGNTGYDAYNCSPQGMLCDYDVEVGTTSSSPVGGFTFQAGMSGALSRIRMITLGGSGERAEVRNRDTGELLGQGVPDSEAYTGYYLWRSFTFSDLALEEGTWYKVTLTGGYYQWIGQHSTNSYPGGTKYGMNASTSGYATFKTIVCAPVPGCMDEAACNYDATANLSANCLYADGPCEICNATGGVDNFDADNDGVCDGDEIPGCQDDTACNYNSAATDSDNSCVYATANCEVCQNGAPVIQDADNDGVCDGDEVAGCQDNSACNYNAAATDSDGSCVYATATCAVCEDGSVVVQDADNDGVCDANEVAGCQDNTACNYDPAATDSDNSCVYATANCEVCQNGAPVVQDADNDGVCDGDEVAGCQDNTACNYDANATDSDNSCIYATGTCEVCEGGQAVVQDADNDGVCNADEVAGCMDASACNYDASATDDQGCNYASVTWYADADGDGTGFAGNTLVDCTQPAGYVLTSGDNCPNDPNKLSPGTCGCGEVDVDADGDGLCDDVDGCADPTACNYAAPLATECFTTNSCGNCGPETTVTCGLQGACNYDPAGDCYDADLCDFDSCAGCMNNNACNYDATATISAPLTCTFPAFAWVDCAGACENDLDQNGVCDEVEIAGCMDSAAINYNPNATTDNGSCFIELVGCIIPVALNYDENATVQGVPLADYCTFPPATGGVPGPGTANAPGPGCMEPSACNYDPEATSDNGSCEYTSCLGCDQPSACNFDPAVLYNDGSCEWTSCAGCMNPGACDYDDQATVSQPCDFSSCLGCTNVLASNYDATASIDDGSCIFPGCTNPAACNFDPTATSNDGSCTYALAYYACNGDCLNDSDGDGVCDEFEVAGCTNASACNYDATATDDDGSCVVATTWYEDVDGDGFGDSASSQTSCTQPPGYVANASDNCPAHAAKQDPGACGCDTADTDADSDGIADCNDDCTDTTACNYDANPTAACVFVTPGYDCDGVCLDLNTNGTCDLDEGEYAGCQDVAACNYDPVASLPDPTSCTYLNFTGIAVDATSQASAADGLVVPAYSGGTGTVELVDTASGAVYPATVWGFMPSGRYGFRMQDAGGCLSVEARAVVIPYAGCD